MFVHEPSLVQLAASPDDVLTLLTSLNKPMVALEDHPMDEGEATIWSVRREGEMTSTYVHLCLTGTKIGVFYRYEVDPYPDDLRGMVEAEALSFSESLGFIMDNTHYAELDAEERKQHLIGGPFEWTGISEDDALELAERSPEEAGPIDLGEASPAVNAESAGADAQEFLSDVEVDDAMRALMGSSPEGIEGPGMGAIDDEFERAVEEFISGDSIAGEEAAVPEPVALPDPALAPAPGTEEADGARSSLSRFSRRKSDSDIYEIRGLGPTRGGPGGSLEVAEAAVEDAPKPAEEAAVPDSVPDAAPTPALLQADTLSAVAEAGDPETRQRRARARFLASF